MHAIRLGPPWQVTATEGGTRHARKFGRPRALESNERLWFVCEHVPGAGEVRVNGELVGATGSSGPFASDITTLLLPRNEVALTVASDAGLGAVVLEIRTSAPQSPLLH
jgi:hypothetical protein